MRTLLYLPLCLHYALVHAVVGSDCDRVFMEILQTVTPQPIVALKIPSGRRVETAFHTIVNEREAMGLQRTRLMQTGRGTSGLEEGPFGRTLRSFFRRGNAEERKLDESMGQYLDAELALANGFIEAASRMQSLAVHLHDFDGQDRAVFVWLAERIRKFTGTFAFFQEDKKRTFKRLSDDIELFVRHIEQPRKDRGVNPLLHEVERLGLDSYALAKEGFIIAAISDLDLTSMILRHNLNAESAIQRYSHLKSLSLGLDSESLLFLTRAGMERGYPVPELARYVSDLKGSPNIDDITAAHLAVYALDSQRPAAHLRNKYTVLYDHLYPVTMICL